MSWRKLTVDGADYQFRFGKGNVVIKSEDGKSQIVDYKTLSGRSWYVIERGQHKRTSDG